MKACIYQPAKTATQSGMGNTHYWLLEFEPSQRKTQYPIMGWTSSGDMRQQLRMKFPTKGAAEVYAKRQGIDYYVKEPQKRKIIIKSYADNFK